MRARTVMLAFILCCCIFTSCVRHSYVAPEYSNHTNIDEDKYITLLADTDQLKSGKQCFVTHETVSSSKAVFTNVKDTNFGYDMRSCDVSEVDFGSFEDLSEISFDSNTKWPTILPSGFDPDAILEYNMNPGLGIRELHERGITGEGIGIAIIDQALLTKHEQYKDNLMLYEKIHCRDEFAQMHGCAVASIAVGKEIGVAPGAKLYYIASTFGHNDQGQFSFDASIIADCIIRILEINNYLPQESRIRVISVSQGYREDDKGYKELVDAIATANKEGILVITTSLMRTYGFDLLGLSRDYWSDPDDPNIYVPSYWYEDLFYTRPDNYGDKYIFVPVGSRTVADSTGIKKYQISKAGGMSWGVPWFAGFYALCCQVNPDITPQKFISVVKNTAQESTFLHEGNIYHFQQIVDPICAVEYLMST